MKKIIFLAALALFIFMEGCNSEKAPVTPDGGSQLTIKAYWNDSQDSIAHYVPMANAKVILSSEYGMQVKNTDANGVLELTGLPSAVYDVSVRMQHPLDASITLVGTRLSIAISPEKAAVDTIYAQPTSNSGIAINEIYQAGSSSNGLKYFKDQFIELYNSSDSVKYLDGMMVMRFTGSTTAGVDQDNDGDIDGLSYAYKFPGNPGERNYPFPPKKFLVLAQYAYNHKNECAASIDLSNADWEFYDQFDSKEFENPNVPNILNMKSDKAVDFMMALNNDVIVISDGRDQTLTDGIDISTVLDGVEFQTDSKTAKTLDSRIDRGYTISPPSYSGKSIQRRQAGEDTNNSQLDWEILPYPTPGYQK
ncbi:MAG TPA: DUF4876 domain-containing protein [Ignavibacteriales bacterium]|nr:DUF4876 domain-containing protein [Ignavibacteriales bacterium]